MLCLRLALVCASATGGKHLATLRLTPSDAPSSCLRALGQLLLSARFFSLLMIPLGLQLGAGETAALQAAGVVAFWWCLSSECRCCFLAHPATQRCFTRCVLALLLLAPCMGRHVDWLTHMPLLRLPAGLPIGWATGPRPCPCPRRTCRPAWTPASPWGAGSRCTGQHFMFLCCTMCAPPFSKINTHPHPCLLQFFWLGVLPCLLVAAREANARKEFALALPRGMLPAAERSAWAAAVVPSSWLITLLFMPAVSLLAWRIAAPMAPCGDAAE